jgi:hypothetical protein
VTVRSSAQPMAVARPRAAACARAALPSEVEVAAARPSVLPEEAVAEEAVAAQPVSAAAEVPRQEVAEVRPVLAAEVPQREAGVGQPVSAAGVLRPAVAAEPLASAERQQEAAAQPAQGARAARLRGAVPFAVAACSCRPAAAPARRRWNRIAPGMARLRIAPP